MAICTMANFFKILAIIDLQIMEKKKNYAPGAKDICPFTRKPVTRRNLVKLTPENIEEFKDKIINQEIALKEWRKALKMKL